MNDQELEQKLRQTLSRGASEPDELTRAALRAARYRALDQLDSVRRPWWQPGLALAGIVLAAVLAWQLNGPEPDLQLASNNAEDAAVIADLDLLLWLQEGEV